MDPEFTSYIESQNAKIRKGTIKGEKIKMTALAINNGSEYNLNCCCRYYPNIAVFDGLIQYAAYIDFAYYNSYNRLISKDEYDSLYLAYNTVSTLLQSSMCLTSCRTVNQRSANALP